MAGTEAADRRWGSGISGSGTILAANRLVLLIAVPLFLILALVAYLTIQSAINERAARGLGSHSHQVMEVARELQDDVQPAESSQRGYLIDRDRAYYQAYLSAVARVPADIKAFRNITADDPSQQRRADRMETLIAGRLALLSTNITLGTAPHPDMARLSASLQQGRLQMSALRSELSAALAEELDLLAQRDRHRRMIENLEISFAIGAGVLTLGILLIAAAMLVRNNVSLAAAEKARANEAAILQATLETVREGIAYFNNNGLLYAFNAGFFTLLDLPEELAVLAKTRLADLKSVESVRPFADRIFSPPAQHQDGGDARHIVWAGRELDIYKAPVATGGFLIVLGVVTPPPRAPALGGPSQKMEAHGPSPRRGAPPLTKHR